MDELIRLLNDISAPIRLGWLGVLVWGSVQVMWYRRGRVLPDEIDAASEGWSFSTLLLWFKRSSDSDDEPVVRRSPLSIAPEMDLAGAAEPVIEPDLGAAAELALGNLLANRADHDAFDSFSGRGKVVRHRKRSGNPASSHASGLGMETSDPA